MKALLPFLITIASVLHGKVQIQQFTILLAEDIGRDWISCYGAEHATPNIDALASQSIRFETAWSMPDATLSKASLLTGQYPGSEAKSPTLPSLLGDKFQLINIPREGSDFPAYVDKMDATVGKFAQSLEGTGNILLFTSTNGSAAPGKLNGKPFPSGKGTNADIGVHVPFLLHAPAFIKDGRVSKDLVDFTDIYPTFLELAGLPLPSIPQPAGKSLLPILQGSDDPFDKRNWIYARTGNFQMVRDWHHIVDTNGAFHALANDPLQEKKVRVQDKQAPHRQERLQMILHRFAGSKE